MSAWETRETGNAFLNTDIPPSSIDTFIIIVLIKKKKNGNVLPSPQLGARLSERIHPIANETKYSGTINRAAIDPRASSRCNVQLKELASVPEKETRRQKTETRSLHRSHVSSRGVSLE